MTYSTAQAEAELRRFRRWRVDQVLEVGAAGEPDRIHGTLLLAIPSRETNLRNIVGGGHYNNAGDFVVTGEDRGLYQINDGYHGRWLASVPGCDSGTYKEIYASALPAGRVPGLTRGARKCRDLLRDRVAVALRNGVPEADALRVAVAAYNAGSWGALKGYRAGDPDHYTTGKNYSADVLARQRTIRRALRSMRWA